MKLALAYRTYIEGKVVQAMESCVSGTNPAKHGISGYIANGFSDAHWIETSRNVELANGGSKVYALGTKIGLQNVLPSTPSGAFRYDENSALIKKGFLPDYKGVPMIEIGNALIPNTINGTPQTVVNDKIIYMLPRTYGKKVA